MLNLVFLAIVAAVVLAAVLAKRSPSWRAIGLSGIVLILLLIAVTRLINMLEFELKPILMKTNETLGTIRGTTVFMSQNVVRPMTTASSYMAGIRRGVNTLFGNPRR